MEKYEIRFIGKPENTATYYDEYVAVKMFKTLMSDEQKWLTNGSLARFNRNFIDSVAVGNMTLRRVK